MGLLSGLLFLPLTPVRGVGWLAEQIADAAEREAYDPAPLMARLAALHRELDEDEIDLAEFEREEERLLREVQRRQAITRGLPTHRPGRKP